MKVRPIRILLFVCGGGIVLAGLLGVLGIATDSSKVKKAGSICFLIAAIASCVPLVATCGYLLWKKIRSARSPGQSTPTGK
jgi:hypothetical protein